MGRAVTFLLVAGALSGCASAPAAINPVSWWHGLEGGPIAGQRPPPPRAAAPYPNLANVPTPPAFLPAQARDRISASLLADRQSAGQQAVLEPLPNATATDAGPSPLTPAPAASAPSPGTASASLPAITRPAPELGPEPPPAPLPANVATAVAALPGVPLAPPPPPSVAGIGQPGSPPAPFTAAATDELRVGFAPGSAVLAAADRTQLAALAARRGSSDVAVIGLGGADTSGAPAQSAALRLGLARAQAVAAALAQLNVPDAALRLGAEASGNGAVVRLIR
ncbi:MAG: hypothetical protein ACREFS_12245 [Acetobacteraceae bacterium]